MTRISGGRSWLTRQVAGASFMAVALAICGVVCAPAAIAADSGMIKRGDAVVTGFAGTKTDKDVPPTVHPLDRTFIDVNGSAAQVFDLSVMGTAPRGQLSDVASKLKIKAADTGQVFGVALDDAAQPNIYLTSTSMFGLQIVNKDSAGKLNRLVTGASDAQWMPGQFGLDKGGTPGTIYKINGVTGEVTLFATIKTWERDNAGPGLGNITFDPKTHQLFVSDLESGIIHRITLDGKERDLFDHGDAGRKAQGLDVVAYDDSRRMDITQPSFNSEDPTTWGYADARRRVFGLAVSGGRLYYAVAEGPSIWSVSIDNEGDFGSDPRIEIELKGSPAATDITDIVLDDAGKMYLSQRGSGVGSYDYTTFAKPQQASVLRYKWDEKEGRWLANPDEYSIGLPKDYHATQGGVALNYGYDKFGNINYSACHQTLWTTGEHLREGDGPKQVSTASAEIVHGLQGVYTSRVRPANEPPQQSWFTDYDGRFGDVQAFGHIGDVAIYAPCDPAQQRPDIQRAPNWPWPYPPLVYDIPVDEPGLTLAKHCFAGAIGGKIRCTITVSNLSGRVVSQNIKFTDVTRTLFGPGAGSVVPIVAFAPSVPDITCTPAPTTDFACSMPAAILLPGDAVSVDVWIDTHDLALSGNLGFRNCATLKHPDGYSQACAEGGTDIVVEKIGPGTCLPGGTCKFGLKIANIGTMPYDGDVLLADAMFIGGGSVGAAVTSVAPPVACLAGNMAQLPFTCVTHLSLLPGEEHLHWVDVTMPAPGGYWAQNCFGALDPALLPVGPVPPGLGGGGPGQGNPSCVWVHVPVPQANLALTKTALNGGKCDKLGADLLCRYEIAVTNQDSVPYNGVLKIQETVPAGATLPLVSPPWGCAGGPPSYTCDTGGPVVIPAGGTVAFNATVAIPVAVSEASFCLVPNKAKILVPPGGAAPNLDATDDESSATAWTTGLFWEDPITHITFVMCDPTNLKVQKAAKSCAKSGNGFECGYDVTVTNTGPDPYKGPVKLDETFGGSPTNVTFGGDFTCNGGGASYKCETPVVSLAKGASLTLTVKANVPASGTCKLPNTATMTFPPVGSKGNGKGDDDSASATADVPAESCSKVQTFIPLPIPPTTVSRCPDGLPLPRNGKCPCPDGGTWDRESGQCGNGEPKQPQGCTPGINEVKVDGRCVCREGYWNNDGRCVKDDEPQHPRGCTPGAHEYKADNGRCLCDEGYSRNDGQCVRDRDEPQGCKPGSHEYKADNGRCLCDEGYSRNDGQCVKDRPEPPTQTGCKPGPHEYKADNGRCLCDDGYTRDDGQCVVIRNVPVPLPLPIDPGVICKKQGRVWTGSRCIDRQDPGEDCREKGGKWLGSDGCYFPPKQKDCPEGTHGKYPQCSPDFVPPKPKYCPEGTHGNWPDCKQDRPDPPKQPKHCPRGMQGEPPECYWPKPQKDDTPPKKKFPDIEIFKKPKNYDPPVRKVPNSDGPVIRDKPIFKEKPVFKVNPGIFNNFQKQSPGGNLR